MTLGQSKASSYHGCKRRSEEIDPAVLERILLGQFATHQAIRIKPRENESVDRKGVDVWVECQNGVRLGTDLKVRTLDCRNFGQDDVVLELVSNLENGSPGWALKPGVWTDFFVVIWSDSQRALKMPAEGLQRAVFANLERWWELYPPRLTPTKCHWLPSGRYHSVAIYVPRKELLQAIAAVGGQVDPCDLQEVGE